MKATLIGRLVPPMTLAALSIAIGGCTVGEMPPEKRATATMEARSGTQVTGSATFTKVAGGQVKMVLTMNNATQGQHAVHLHAVPDCTAIDGASAGGHWNPEMVMHALPTAATNHMGDCGNLEVGPGGTGTLEITKTWSIGTGDIDDVVGHAIIFHAAIDDGMTQPTGNAGGRQACGVVNLLE